jgi:hypothetical protein
VISLLVKSMEQKIKRRKVLELPSKLAFAIARRVLIANELKGTDIVIESVEKVDGSKPRLLIRIKRLSRSP